MNVKSIWEGCVELITANALPLAVVESPAFKKIIEPYATALRRQGIELNINKRAIKACIEKRAIEIKKQIIAETKGRLVHLMMDIATRYNRSVLGINLKYMLNGSLVIRTIGMETLHFAHTAENLRVMIIKKLEEYELSLENVFSITTDNGRNVMKAVAELNQTYQNERDALIAESLENDNDESAHESSDEEIDMDIFDDEYYVDLLTNLRSSFGNVEYSNLIQGVSCAAHCLNLVVTRAIENCQTVKSLITRARQLVKKLRSPTYRHLISNLKMNQPIIDIVTRWNSIYSMVSMNVISSFDNKSSTEVLFTACSFS